MAGDFNRGDLLPVDGLRIISVDVAGRVDEVLPGPAAGTPVRDAEPGDLADLLAEEGVPDGAALILGSAAAESAFRRELSVPLPELVAPASMPGGTRAAEQAPHLEMELPAPPPDEGQVVLEVDSTGVVRWHVSRVAAAGNGTDRSGDVQVFTVPVEQVDLQGDAVRERGVLSFGVRKVLHVLRYPVRAVAGLGAETAVGWWERKARPYRLSVSASGPLPAAPGEDRVRWDDLGSGPCLVLVHGTFSTGRSAFAGIGADAELLAALRGRYGGRVLVFDHPSVHVDPGANARWLLEQLPPDRRMVLDVVAHSRGGLVARHLDDPELAAQVGRQAPRLGSVVHVATPNAGTALASPDRLVDLLDVASNVFSLLPDDTVAVPVEAVLEVVKQVGSGVLAGLDGLAAMDPKGKPLTTLNSRRGAGSALAHAVTTDYEPGRGSVALSALDLLVDGIFGAGNDLVVPTQGVHSAGEFRIDDPLTVPTHSRVSHTTFFRDADVRHALAGWLPGASVP